jgi:polyisoprenoid-binding protein YceI
MKKIMAILLMAVMAFGVELTVDKKVSSIDFEATEMFFIGVDGKFSNFSGTISVKGDTVTAINGKVAVLSISFMR